MVGIGNQEVKAPGFGGEKGNGECEKSGFMAEVNWRGFWGGKSGKLVRERGERREKATPSPRERKG